MIARLPNYFHIIFILFIEVSCIGRSDSDLGRTYLLYVEGLDQGDDRLGDRYDQNYINQWDIAKLRAKVCHRTQRTRL